MKTCSVCLETKDAVEFSYFHRSPDKLQSKCKDCSKKASKEYFAENEQRRKLLNAAEQTRKEFGYKKCSKCEAGKRPEEFNIRLRSKDGLTASCKECIKSSAAKAYQKRATRAVNPFKSYRSQVHLRERRRLMLERHLIENPCVDCGEADIRVLDFDHRPGEVKIGNVPSMVDEGRSDEIISAEVNKCDIRCRNCHAIKTYERTGKCWRIEAEERRRKQLND